MAIGYGFSEENYSNYDYSVYEQEMTDEQFEEFLKGVVLSEAEIQEKIAYAMKRYGLKESDIKLCIFYGRVSTKHKEQVSSIKNQDSIADDFEADYMSRGFIIIEKVFERNSGTLIEKRPKFMNLVQRGLSNNNLGRRFDFIVVKQVDRMFRNVRELLNTMDELKDKKRVGLLFYFNDLNSLIESDRNKIIDEANRAETYSNNLSRSVKQGQERNIRNGKGRLPGYAFGLVKPPVRNSAIGHMDTEKAKLIYDAFERYAYTTDTFAMIADDWNGLGIKSELGKKITPIAIKRILTNELYKGIVRNGTKTKNNVREKYRDVPEDEQHVFYRPELRVVSDELFDAVQKRIKAEEFGHKHMLAVTKDRIFTSMIQCPVCGKNFRQITNGKRREVTEDELTASNLYFVCPTYKYPKRWANDISCDNNSTFRKDEMLECLSLYFQEMLEKRENITELVRNSVTNLLKKLSDEVDKKDYSAEIAEVKKRLERETTLFREGIVETTTELNRLKKELKDLETKQVMENKTAQLKFDVDEVMDRLYTNIENLVKTGMKEETLPAVEFNRLFDSIVATDDDHLIFNLKASRVFSDANIGSQIGSFFTPTKVGVTEAPISEDSDISSFFTPTEVGVTEAITSGSMYGEHQIRLLREQRDKGMVYIPVESLFNCERLYDGMNNRRNLNTENRRRYRYSERYKGLGRTIIDSVNIVL